MGGCSSKHESPSTRPPSAVEMEAQAPAATPPPTQMEKAASSTAFGFDCFLSHDWSSDALGRSNHARVVAIKRRLAEERELRCWLDEEEMQGDINQAMTDGIDDSATVIVFITERYLMKVAGKGPNGHDDNCKMEFDYACLRRGVGKMIAVVMEPGMRSTKSWSGVAGAKLGTSLYIDISAEEADAEFASGVHQLAKEVRKRAGASAPDATKPSATATAPATDGSKSMSSKMNEPPEEKRRDPGFDELMAEERAKGGVKSRRPPRRLKQTQAAPSVDDITVSPRSDPSSPAEVPEEVPEPPKNALERSALLDELKERVLPRAASSAELTKSISAKSLFRRSSSKSSVATKTSNATIAVGMGGVGKTTSASLFVREPVVRSKFDRICWVSVGQEPDTAVLQQSLHLQLAEAPLPEAAVGNKRAALMQLRHTAKPLAVLLVLDDVWDRAQALHLNFIDPASSSSALLVTTRIRSLLDGAAEVACELLDEKAALQLLLRTGGCEGLIDSPPPAALQAVELCGRLPLALGIAGAIIEELADSWQGDLIPMLKETEFDDQKAAVEERVVAASLRAVPQMIRAGVAGLFALLGLFAEDALVPSAAVDVLAPSLIPGNDAVKKSAQKRLQVRRWLQQLLKGNIVRGSIETGVCVHDLVRDCMIRRAESSPGGLRGLQRDAVPLLIATYAADEPAAPYVADNLQWHVRQSKQPDVPIHADPLIMKVLTHESGAIRKQGAVGIGMDVLQAAAEECDAAREHLKAAELMYAACAVRGSAAGAEAQRAWASLRKLEEAGQGSKESRALETRVANALMLATQGGFAFGSDQHTALLKRMRELGSATAETFSPRSSAAQSEHSAVTTSKETMGAQSGLGDLEGVHLQAQGTNSVLRSKEAMDSAWGVALAELLAAFHAGGVSGYPGPQTKELVVKSCACWKACAAAATTAAAAAPDDVFADVVRQLAKTATLFDARQHVLPEFVLEEACGAGGELLRAGIENYNFDRHHSAAKNLGMSLDHFTYGCDPLGLLLFFGDLAGARAGFAKLIDVSRRIRARVEQGAAAAEEYAYEMWTSTNVLLTSLLASGDMASLRELMAHSLLGKVVEDDKTRAGMEVYWHGAFGSWTTEGHLHSTFETYLLTLRGIFALLNEGEAATTLQPWLPSPAELLRIAEVEGAWRCHSVGANHPALLCARLHGERLGKWDVTAQVAEGVLQIEQFNPLLRTEACRLLGRARLELGQRKAACEAAEAAWAEAAKAKYVWFELLSLRDLLRWSEAADAEGVQSRLSSVQGRMAATAEELAGVLGEGVLLSC